MAAAPSLQNGTMENQNYRQLRDLVTGMPSAAYLPQNHPGKIIPTAVFMNGTMSPSQNNIPVLDPLYQQNISLNNLNGTNPAIIGQSLDTGTAVLHLRVGGQLSYSEDLTPVQANAKIEDLAKENNDLKGFLKENTDILKKQYEKLDEYKLRIQTTGTQHLEKLNRAKDVVQKLRNEISKIHGELSRTRDEHDTKYKRVMTECQLVKECKSQDDYLIDELQKVKDLQELKLEGIEEHEKAMVIRMQKTGTSKTDVELENIPAQFEVKLQEIADMKEQNERLLNEMHQFKSTNNRLLEINSERDHEVKSLTDENLILSASVQKNLCDIKALKDRIEQHTREKVTLRNKLIPGRTAESSDISSSRSRSSDILAEGSPPGTLRLSTAGTQTLECDDRQCKHDDVIQEKSYAGLLDQMQNERSQVIELRAQLVDQEVIINKLRADLQSGESEHNTTGESDVEHQSKISNLTAYIDQLKKQLEEARTPQNHTQPESMAEHYAHEIQMLRSQVLGLIKEVQVSERKLILANENVEHKNNIIGDMEGKQAMIMNKQHAHEDTLIGSMKMVIANLEVGLAKERTEHQDARKQYAGLRQSFSSIVSDYNELMETVDHLRNMQDKKNADTVPESEHKKVVDHLTAQLVGAEEAIAFRDGQVKDLKKNVMMMKGQVEEIPVLKAQLDIFQSDFNAEREAREKQHEEKERILQALHSLQIQHQTLTDELESYSRNQITQMMMAHGNANWLPGAHLQQNNRRMLDYTHVTPAPVRAGHPEQARAPPPGNDLAISTAISLAGGTAMSVAAGAPAAQASAGARTPPSKSQFYVGSDAHTRMVTPRPMQESQARLPAYATSVKAPANVSYAPYLDRNVPLVRENVQQQAMTTDDATLFSCPKCDLQCPDYDTLRIHVDECLETD